MDVGVEQVAHCLGCSVKCWRSHWREAKRRARQGARLRIQDEQMRAAPVRARAELDLRDGDLRLPHTRAISGDARKRRPGLAGETDADVKCTVGCEVPPADGDDSPRSSLPWLEGKGRRA